MPREILTPAQAAQSTNVAPNDFKDRLIKLIPAEIITAYVTISGLILASGNGDGKLTPDQEKLLWIVLVILMTLTPFYLSKVSGVTKKGQLIFSTIGFLVWAFATAPPHTDLILGSPHQLIFSIVLILYTLGIPAFYRG